jgi:hypothetical protein
MSVRLNITMGDDVYAGLGTNRRLSRREERTAEKATGG